MDDLSEEERELATKEEAEVERRREEARRAAAEKGLADALVEATDDEPSSRAMQVEPDEDTP